MRILVTFAVDAEFAPWRKLREFRKEVLSSKDTRSSGVAVSRHAVAGEDIEVLLTGIGRESCETALSQFALYSRGKPDLVVSSGLAGALKDCLSVSAVFVPEKVRTLRNDVSAAPDPDLYNLAVQQGALPVENMITSLRLVQSAEEKARLAFFGEAVDMESAFVLSYFAAIGVPVVAIRAVSDAAGEDLPLDFDRCLSRQGAIRPLRLANAIVSGPDRLPRLIRFGRQSLRTSVKLAGFLDHYVDSVRVAREKAQLV